MLNKKIFLIGLILASVCILNIGSGQTLKSRSFIATGIEDSRVQYIWLELPERIEPGRQSVRVFMATTNPPKMILPTMSDVPCMLSNPNEFLAFGPIALPFEFEENGKFKSSYTWLACAKCDHDCYMPSDFTLYITGTIRQDVVSLELAMYHYGKPAPVPFVNVELRKAQTAEEPRMECNRHRECKDIYYVKGH
jgi:hypothetical protein